jgi:hypothetical protein
MSLEPVFHFPPLHFELAKIAAAMVFVTLLGGLGVGALRARRSLERDEVEAALEADFKRIERELSEQDRSQL